MNQGYLGFELDDLKFGIALDVVRRVSPIVALTPLPKSPRVILGLINVQGRGVPVMDIRHRLGLPKRPFKLSDHLIILEVKGSMLAFVVDRVTGIIPVISENEIPLDQIFHKTPLIERAIKIDERFILILNSKKLLNIRESKKLEKLLKEDYDDIHKKLAIA